MGKPRLRLAGPIALVLFLAPVAAQAQTAAVVAKPAAKTARGAAYRAGRGFVRAGHSSWIPADRLPLRETGGIRVRSYKKARLMTFYIPETRKGVAGFRVERLYGMADGEAPESVELGPDGKAKVEAAYATAVSKMVEQHIAVPRAERLHWRAIRDLETVKDAHDPIATGRRSIEKAVSGFDRWTFYKSPTSHQETQARRNQPPTQSVSTTYTRDGLAVVRLSGFTKGIAEQIKSDLGRQRPRGIVLDLRGNGGGLTTESRALLELFAPDNRLLSRRTTRDNGKVESFEWRAETPGALANIPLFVLVDERSASASETVTSSLKDNQLARIGGVKSLGKGVGQTTTDLEDGGAVQVTQTTIQGPTTRYHGIGLSPDVSAADLENIGRAAASRPGADTSGGDLVILGALEHLRAQARP
jgi:hypothetical protein